MNLRFRNRMARLAFSVIIAVFLLAWIIAIPALSLSGSRTATQVNTLIIIFGLCPASLIYLLLILFLTVPTNPNSKNTGLVFGCISSSFIFFCSCFITSQLVGYIDNFQRCNIDNPSGFIAECNFEGQDFTGINLKGVNLSEANLSGVNFTNAILSEANLYKATLAGANLTHATLDKANVSHVRLGGANLTEASLVGTNLNDSELTKANLSRAKLDQATLVSANLSNADVTDATFNGANLERAILIDTIGVTNAMFKDISEWRGLSLESEQSISEQVKGACSGKGLKANTAYVSDESFHPLLVISSGTERKFTTPREWLPSQAHLTQLIACVEETNNLIETCEYDGTTTTIKRYRATSQINIVAVKNGKLIDEITLKGKSPNECPEKISSKSFSTTYDEGPVDSAKIIEALSKYVNPTGKIERLSISDKK